MTRMPLNGMNLLKSVSQGANKLVIVSPPTSPSHTKPATSKLQVRGLCPFCFGEFHNLAIRLKMESIYRTSQLRATEALGTQRAVELHFCVARPLYKRKS